MVYHGSLTRTNFENALTPGSLQITRIFSPQGLPAALSEADTRRKSFSPS